MVNSTVHVSNKVKSRELCFPKQSSCPYLLEKNHKPPEYHSSSSSQLINTVCTILNNTVPFILVFLIIIHFVNRQQPFISGHLRTTPGMGSGKCNCQEFAASECSTATTRRTSPCQGCLVHTCQEPFFCRRLNRKFCFLAFGHNSLETALFSILGILSQAISLTHIYTCHYRTEDVEGVMIRCCCMEILLALRRRCQLSHKHQLNPATELSAWCRQAPQGSL